MSPSSAGQLSGSASSVPSVVTEELLAGRGRPPVGPRWTFPALGTHVASIRGKLADRARQPDTGVTRVPGAGLSGRRFE